LDLSPILNRGYTVVTVVCITYCLLLVQYFYGVSGNRLQSSRRLPAVCQEEETTLDNSRESNNNTTQFNRGQLR
jgi:hypothetical protein